MQKFVSTLLIILFTIAYSTESYAIVSPTPAAAADARQERFQKRMQNIKDKLERKLYKKQHKKAAPPQIWEDGRFRLGIFAFAIALGLALISALGILSGFFGFLSGIAALAGLVLVIWALVDYSY